MILFIVKLFVNDKCFGFYIKSSLGFFDYMMKVVFWNRTPLTEINFHIFFFHLK